jgi:hypothetical protein
MVEKEIVYTNHSASGVNMVWGINYLKMPPKEFWPLNSERKNDLVTTKMIPEGNEFRIKIRLPDHTILNYWMVIKKDQKGNETDK